MPTRNAEQWKAKAEALRKKLREGAAKLDGPKTRALKKRIRRAQRRRRSIVARTTRVAQKPVEKKET